MSDIKIKRRGSREEVLNGRAELTTGGLTKDDLVYNPRTKKIATRKEMERGSILSKSMIEAYVKVKAPPAAAPAPVEADPVHIVFEEPVPQEEAMPVEAEPEVAKKPRGRPRKVADTSAIPSEKKPRGRPRKDAGPPMVVLTC